MMNSNTRIIESIITTINSIVGICWHITLHIPSLCVIMIPTVPAKLNMNNTIAKYTYFNLLTFVLSI